MIPRIKEQCTGMLQRYSSQLRLPLLFAIAIFLSSLQALEPQIQAECKSSYFYVKPHRYIDSTASEGFLFNTNVYSTNTITANTMLMFDYRLRGTNHDDLFPELQLPIDHYFYAGFMDYELFGTFQAGFSNELFPFADSFPMPYQLHLPTVYLRPDMLNAANGSWRFENSLINLEAKTTCLRSTYKLVPGDLYVFNGTARQIGELFQPPYGQGHDADLWTDVSGTITLWDDFGLNGGWLMKNDLNKYNGYDISRLWGSISGEHQLLRKKLVLEWEARERLLSSEVMYGNEYATGLGTDFNARMIWRRKGNLFIKGLSRLELGRQLHKLFYQTQIRKLFDNNSSIGLDYFGTTGVLFPRQGGRMAGTILFTPHFGISPVLEGYFSRLPNESAFRYYRSDMKLELQYSIRPRMELLAGWSYRNYDRHPLFASRSSLYTGLNAW